MKKETLDLIEFEINRSLKRYNDSGYIAEIIYFPCIVLKGSKGEIRGMEYPNTSTIVKSENDGINP